MPNPQTKQFGLKHRFYMDFSLHIEESTPDQYATVIPLFFADQAKTESVAQGIQVNRANDSYEGVVRTPACHMNSRVNKIKITEYHRINSALDVPDQLLFKGLFNFNFPDVDVKDPAGVSLLSKLKFTKAADTLHPTWSTIKLDNDHYYHADVDGLTTNQSVESVNMYPSELRDHREGSLGPKVRSVLIGPMLNRMHKDFPLFNERWYDVPGKVKRMNAFAGCFLYVGLPKTKLIAPSAQDTMFGTTFDSETTLDEVATHHHFAIEFNEFHDSFDQVA